jgi:hypothetical protein
LAKKILLSIAISFCLWIVFFSYLRIEGKKYGKECRMYLLSAIPKIFSDWNLQLVYQEMHPQFLTLTERIKINSAFKKSSEEFGRLKDIGDIDGNVTVNLTTGGISAVGKYEVPLTFEKGRTLLSISVLKTRLGWKITRLRLLRSK